jgi:hypothetical protein
MGFYKPVKQCNKSTKALVISSNIPGKEYMQADKEKIIEMNTQKKLIWFKETITPKLGNYEIKYKFFEEGDFGSLNQIEFNNEQRGGNIDFWNSGWVGIHLVDYLKGDELMNLMIEPNKLEEMNNNLEKLVAILLSK